MKLINRSGKNVYVITDSSKEGTRTILVRRDTIMRINRLLTSNANVIVFAGDEKEGNMVTLNGKERLIVVPTNVKEEVYITLKLKSE